jgi:hypothetical protein
VSRPSLDVGGAVQEREHTALIAILPQEQREPSQCFRKMNEQAQACLGKAEEREHSAQRTTDENARLLYLDLAKQWRTLAEHVETVDRQRTRFEQSEPKPEGT